MEPIHYIVRVELHKATADDYQKLHSIMLKAGFGNVIKDDNGRAFTLPTAEYHALETTDYSAMQVRNHVGTLIDPLGLKYWVLVSKASQIAWFLAETTIK